MRRIFTAKNGHKVAENNFKITLNVGTNMDGVTHLCGSKCTVLVELYVRRK
jgi:hypothetical protein